MADRNVVVHILGDSRSYERALKRSSDSTKKFQRAFDGFNSGRGGGLPALTGRGVGIAAVGVAAGIAISEVKDLSGAASDLNEEVNKNQVVFGRSSEAILDWSKTTAKAIGVSRTEALRAAGVFGNLFDTVGLGDAQAAQMSQRLVRLAADLASFNNANPSDVLDAIRSGLIGEAEPLRRFGVLLSEARVQQRAMADSGKTTAKSLTDQEKAIARYELILGDTKTAQGDFARTSGGLANQQRILKARLADTRAELGTHFLPVMLKATEAANKFFDVLDGNQATLDDFFSRDFRSKFLQAFGPDALDDALKKLQPQINKSIEDFAKTIQPIPLTIKPTVDTKTPAFGQPGFKPGKAAVEPPRGTFITPEQRNRFFDDALARDLDKVQDSDLRGQLAKLRAIEGTIEQRIEITKDITRKLNLEDKLRSVRRQARSVSDEITQAAADKRKADQDARALRRERARTQLTARQFRELGLTSEGETPTPGVANLKKRTALLADQIAGTKFDTPKLRSELARFRKVLSEGLVGKDVRAKIDSMLTDIGQTIRGGLDKKVTGPLTKTTSLNADKLLSGIGLARDDARILRARLSHFNSAGVALAGVGAPSVTVQIDGRQIEPVMTKRQQQRTRRNPPKRRGR